MKLVPHKFARFLQEFNDMKDVRLMLRSLPPALALLPILGIAAVVIVLCSGALQTEAGDSSTPGFTSFDAPGAGTTASSLEGTAAFSINTAGDIAGFETDSSGVHH